MYVYKLRNTANMMHDGNLHPHATHQYSFGSKNKLKSHRFAFRFRFLDFDPLFVFAFLFALPNW